MKQTMSLSEFSCLSEYTRHYPTQRITLILEGPSKFAYKLYILNLRVVKEDIIFFFTIDAHIPLDLPCP